MRNFQDSLISVAPDSCTEHGQSQKLASLSWNQVLSSVHCTALSPLEQLPQDGCLVQTCSTDFLSAMCFMHQGKSSYQRYVRQEDRKKESKEEKRQAWEEGREIVWVQEQQTWPEPTEIKNSLSSLGLNACLGQTLCLAVLWRLVDEVAPEKSHTKGWTVAKLYLQDCSWARLTHTEAVLSIVFHESPLFHFAEP